MGATQVSVVVPLSDGGNRTETVSQLESYLRTTGFEFEILTPGGPYGAAIRKGVSDAAGSIIIIADATLPYPLRAIGDAVAMVDSESTEIVFPTTSPDRDGSPTLARWLIAPILPDPRLRLKALSSAAAKLIIGETKLDGLSCELEIAFLANKYGFRVERLTVDVSSETRCQVAFDGLSALLGAFRIRWTDRHMDYRAARRCPVCFSPNVWSRGQIPGNVVRACYRCKCRYLHEFSDDEERPVARRVARGKAEAAPALVEFAQPNKAREKTSIRRLAGLRSELPSRARVLEVGVRDGSFGRAASREFEYVGIDSSDLLARNARSSGLEVYCASLASFVNTGPSFDAVTLFHVFENMSDPHHALERIKDLLKPGGVLLLTTFDTEGLFYLLSEKRRMAHNFRNRRILYSRSALIELLEHSGFEIAGIGPDFEYREHKFLRHLIGGRWSSLAPLFRLALTVLPDPLLVSSGSIRILARRRSGPPVNVRAIRSVEPTHAR